MSKNKSLEVKQNHVESNPLYEIALDNIAEQLNQIINTLEVSGLHANTWHVFRAHKQLVGLRDSLIKGQA